MRVIGIVAFLAGAAVAAAQSAPSGSAQAELPGHVAGRISASDDGEALPFATIQAYRLSPPADTLGRGAGIFFADPPDGTYAFELPPGEYRLQYQYVSCETASRPRIRIGAGETVRVDVQLVRRRITLLPITVTARRVRNTEEAVLAEQRQAVAVADAISSEQIRKSADGNAAEALQRVSGISTVGERYIFVRGLGERYSSTLINGAAVGSPEPNKKVVPLDLIPSQLLDQVFIQKTFTPDQPGEFGGGTVNIRTRDFPERRTWSLGVTSGAEEGTGGTFYRYRGGERDFLGFDDGTRDVPKLVRDMAGDTAVRPRGVGSTSGFTREEIEALGESFNKIWSGTTQSAKPAYGVNATYGDRYEIFGREAGILVGGVLKNSFSVNEHEENSYEPGTGDELAPRTQYDVKTSTAKTQLGLLGSVGLQPEEHTKLHLTSFFNRASEDEYQIYEGLNTDHGVTLRDTRLRFIGRTVWASQLEGEHELLILPGASLDWNATYSRAAMDEPDRREYVYEWRPRVEQDDEEEEGPASPAQEESEGAWELAVRNASMGFTRLFGKLDEEERGASVMLALPLPLGTARDAKLRLGYQLSRKDRDVSYRRFVFSPPTSGWDRSMPPESLLADSRVGGSPREFRLTELTRATDAYTARIDVHARYLLCDLPVLPRLRAVAGIRSESWTQSASTYDPFVPGGDVIAARLAETDILPCLNLTYALGPSMNLRAGYSHTISRPDLRELTPFELSQYESGWSMRGNPDLKRAKLRNFDLRWESYPAAQELLAVSAFYKRLIDPIEKTLRIAGGQLREVPENGSEGYLYGGEFEARAGLGRITRRLASFALASNVTIVRSRATLSQDGVQTSTERPLAGQSPYLVNAMLFYDPRGRWYSASVLYNVSGKRLDGVGAMGLPDIYEEAHGALDAALSLRWGGTGFKLTAENLTDEEVRCVQSDYVTRRVRKGRGFSLAVSRGN